MPRISPGETCVPSWNAKVQLRQSWPIASELSLGKSSTGQSLPKSLKAIRSTWYPHPGKERQRERVLTEDEIKRIWNAIDADRKNADDSHLKVKTLSAGIMKLRLLTAQRGAEVMSMEWDEIDTETGWWTIPGDKTKNGLSHRVPLTRPGIRDYPRNEIGGRRRLFAVCFSKSQG